MIPMVASNLSAATGMERGLALTTVTFISTTIPGVFGFLAWELKENWRLYAANRPRTLRPVQVGRHGESMRRLLLPGFHSGTIPKLFGKLRRQLRGRDRASGTTRAGEQLAELAHDIAAFVDDECLGLLRRTRALGDVAIEGPHHRDRLRRWRKNGRGTVDRDDELDGGGLPGNQLPARWREDGGGDALFAIDAHMERQRVVAVDGAKAGCQQTADVDVDVAVLHADLEEAHLALRGDEPRGHDAAAPVDAGRTGGDGDAGADGHDAVAVEDDRAALEAAAIADLDGGVDDGDRGGHEGEGT
jgi:hypothetical protein